MSLSIQSEFLTPQVTENIRGLVQSNLADITNRTSQVVGRYFAGHHRLVFDLKDHPDYIVKLTSNLPTQQRMRDAMEKSRLLASTNNLFRCKVPESQLVEVNDRVLFIEQKLKGIYDSCEARDASEVEFRRFKDEPELQAKWVEIFVQAAKFITLTGYHDVDWRNILMMGDSVGFVDFEGVSLPDENGKPDPHAVGSGISRLLEMAPLEALDPIMEIALRYDIRKFLFLYSHQEIKFVAHGYKQRGSFDEAFGTLKSFREKELARHTAITKLHKEKGIDDPRTPIDGSAYKEGSAERAIIDKFNEFEYKENLKSPIEIRKLSWQPFIFSKPEFRIGFDAALASLKENKVIAGWEKEVFGQPECDNYTIYF